MLKIFNTLSKKKETFKPFNKDNVKIYLCGPTVYDLLHVGNFRGVIFFNLVRNFINHSGYKSTFILNFTDIDDKIIDRANLQKKSTTELTEHYIKEYKKDITALELPPHDANPKCTHHIPDMIKFIETLIKKNNAYHVEGSVFYSISSFPNYGKLSGKKIEDLNQGHRIDPDPRKKHPLDFVLWKPAKENEPSWESPWGEGRPGWHIECSAMNHALHGDQIDIHGGGIDLIFPHHENEIAQTESLTQKKFSTYWMHNNFIRFGDEKMSKSLGNVIKTRDYITKYDPEILKYLILSVHYRSELNMDSNQTKQTITRLARIYTALKQAKEISTPQQTTSSETFKSLINTSQEKITSALNDDFNTPVVFATIFECVRQFNTELATKKKKDPSLKANATLFYNLVYETGKLMSLFQQDPTDLLKRLDVILIKENKIDVAYIEDLIDQRNKARKNKDYKSSDEIRDTLANLNILIQDSPEGTIWEINKSNLN